MPLWHFLVCLIFTFCQAAGESPIYALKGEEVKFKPNITGRHDAILWRHDGKMVVDFDGTVEKVYSRYENRIILDWGTAELNIKDLSFEDSGDYEFRRYTEVVQRFHFKLEVLDRVAKPTISCEMNDGDDSNKSGMLLCSAEPRPPQSFMKFEWRFHGKVQPGTNLTISLGDEYDDKVYSCRVSNPLSEETATFTAKDCYPDNDSVLIGILVTIAIVSLLLMGLGIFCCKHNKACFAKGNRHDQENSSRPGATQGSDEITADEHMHFIDGTITNPFTDRLHQGRLQGITYQFDTGFHGETSSLAGSVRSSTYQFDRGSRGETSSFAEFDRVFQDEWPRTGSVRSITYHFGRGSRGETSSFEGSVRSITYHFGRGSRGETSSFEESDRVLQDEWPKTGRLRSITYQYDTSSDEETSSFAESDKETAEGNVSRGDLFSSPTPPTTQPRNHVGDSDTIKDLEKNKDDNEETGSPPSTPRSESHSPLDPSIPARNDKGDADADRLSEPAEEVLPHRDPSDSEKKNELEPADVSTNTMSDLESSTVSEHQGLGTTLSELDSE